MSTPTQAKRVVAQRAPIVPERVRSIGGHSFAFLPHRFLRDGFFASLSAEQYGSTSSSRSPPIATA